MILPATSSKRQRGWQGIRVGHLCNWCPYCNSADKASFGSQLLNQPALLSLQMQYPWLNIDSCPKSKITTTSKYCFKYIWNHSAISSIFVVLWCIYLVAKNIGFETSLKLVHILLLPRTTCRTLGKQLCITFLISKMGIIIMFNSKVCGVEWKNCFIIDFEMPRVGGSGGAPAVEFLLSAFENPLVPSGKDKRQLRFYRELLKYLSYMSKY